VGWWEKKNKAQGQGRRATWGLATEMARWRQPDLAQVLIYDGSSCFALEQWVALTQVGCQKPPSQIPAMTTMAHPPKRLYKDKAKWTMAEEAAIITTLLEWKAARNASKIGFCWSLVEFSVSQGCSWRYEERMSSNVKTCYHVTWNLTFAPKSPALLRWTHHTGPPVSFMDCLFTVFLGLVMALERL